MAARWEKLGRVFCPDRQFPWMLSHAANPVAELLAGDRIRVYFSCRDGRNRSSIGFVEIDLNNPQEILNLSDTPVLSPGGADAFDRDGTSMGCIVQHEGKRYLYYTGWQLHSDVPWRNRIGLAVSDGPDQPFIKHGAPVLDLSPVDPLSMSYPWVLYEAASQRWKMWYGSHLSWGKSNGKNLNDMTHAIKYAESTDGIHWQPTQEIAVNFEHPGEYAIARPCVVREENGWGMWYAWRGETYRIGHAESNDGKRWQRQDDRAGITVSENGWDSESISYPCVFDHPRGRFLLYNGNRFGLTGFGLARKATSGE